MQAQLEGKVEFLEAQVRRLQKTLGGNKRCTDTIRIDLASLFEELTSGELQKVTEERDRIKEEREREVESLHQKLQVMEKSFETILQDAFDALAVRIESARQKWDGDSKSVERSTIQILSEFGKDLRSLNLS